MTVFERNNVSVSGVSGRVMMFSHGFGCDQGMWRAVARKFEPRGQVVLFDHIGSGGALSEAYDPVRHSSLVGYAEDVIEVILALDRGPVTFVGHSVSASIGVLAARARPDLFESLVLVCASPRFIDADDYRGGFAERDIEDLLELLSKNTADWSVLMAPQVVGPSALDVQTEWQASICSIDPAIARAFARVTFLSDHRADYAAVPVPTLLIDSEDDVLAPPYVGAWMERLIPDSRRIVLPTEGHCPHMTDPDRTAAAIAQVWDRQDQVQAA